MTNPVPHTNSKHYHSKDEANTLAIAEQLAEHLHPGDVVALYGDLGAGKTRFVRGLAIGLGLDATAVTSPTFVLLHEYTTPAAAARVNADDMITTLIHIDAYRLSGSDELETIGWDEILELQDAVIAIEWAERIEDDLPDSHIRVEMQHGEGTTRTIQITMVGDVASRSLSAESPSTHPCSLCKKPTMNTSPHFPFCSKRCQLLDLGNWMGGTYSIGRAFDPESDDASAMLD